MSVRRVVTALGGLFFLALGIAIACTAENGGASWLAAALVGGLGAEALYSAWRDRCALLARIGPLP